MQAISTQGGGSCQAFPDVCKVPAPPAPPVPTPFPNIAQLRQADSGSCSSKVRILGKRVLTKRSFVPTSSGAEPGTLRGLVSGTHLDRVGFKSGIQRVRVQGDDVAAHLCPTAHNGSQANAPMGAQTSPSQTRVRVRP